MKKENTVVKLPKIAFNETVTDGVISYVNKDKDIYFNAAKEADIDKDVLSKVSEFNQAYIRSVANATQKIAKDKMVSDKSVKEVKFTTPYGVSEGNNILSGYVREKEYKIGENTFKNSKMSLVVNDNIGITKLELKKLQKDLYSAINK